MSWNGVQTALGADLTKCSLPVIIVMGVGVMSFSSGRGPPHTHNTQKGAFAMEVHVYKSTAGKRQILVRPGRATGKMLVLLSGVSDKSAAAEVTKVLDEMGYGQAPPPPTQVLF